MIKTNLMVSLDEYAVAGDSSVISFKTTDNADSIVVETTTPKVSIKMEDLESAIKELRIFIMNKKHITVVPNETSLMFNSVVEYGDTAEN
jgi:hypothetical protein